MTVGVEEVVECSQALTGSLPDPDVVYKYIDGQLLSHLWNRDEAHEVCIPSLLLVGTSRAFWQELVQEYRNVGWAVWSSYTQYGGRIHSLTLSFTKT